MAVARNTCLCVVEGCSVNEHLSFCVKLFLSVLVFFSFKFKLLSHLPRMFNYHKGCPEVIIRVLLAQENFD